VQFVRGKVEPMTGSRMTRGHGEALNSMDGGVQGSGVISIRSTDQTQSFST
jgi:hypothetical protein